MMTARDRYIAYRRSLGATPRLTHQMVQARGLNFAVWTTPQVAGVPPLVCVNGGLLYDHSLLWPALSPLAAKRQLVFYDQRGRGKTGAPPGAQGARIEHDAGDIPALREALGISRWDLLGHSWGGYLVMAYAARHPDRVAHLTIVDSASPKWTDTDFIFKYVFPEGVEHQGSLDFFDGLGDSVAGKESLHEYLGMLFVSAEKREEFLAHASSYRYARP